MFGKVYACFFWIPIELHGVPLGITAIIIAPIANHLGLRWRSK
jgi:DNA mismatch repair protein MutH